jgi:hypothetical protein
MLDPSVSIYKQVIFSEQLGGLCPLDGGREAVMSILSSVLCCRGRNQMSKSQTPGGLSAAAFQAALDKICGGGHVGVPGNVHYSDWVRPYNRDKTLIATPAAIVRPKSAEEIASVVEFAAQNGFKVQAKSGGHSYGYVS